MKRLLGICLATIIALTGAICPAVAAATVSANSTHLTTAVRPFPQQSVRVPRRAIVTITVKEKEPPAPGFPYLPRGVGDYFAVYFPAIRQGWVNMRDPGSRFGWSAQFPLIGSPHFPSLVPHRRYRMLIAVQHPGRVPLPFPMHVLSVQPTAFRVAALTHEIPLLTSSSPVAIGSTDDLLTDLPVESTGIALDWTADASLTESVQGDACPDSLPVGALDCPHRNLSTYVITTTGFGAGTPLQIVLGEGFDHPENGSFISTYAANLPTPFDAATIVAFGIEPPAELAARGRESADLGGARRERRPAASDVEDRDSARRVPVAERSLAGHVAVPVVERYRKRVH
jgi:hypothetical protein